METAQFIFTEFRPRAKAMRFFYNLASSTSQQLLPWSAAQQVDHPLVRAPTAQRVRRRVIKHWRRYCRPNR